MMKKKKSGEYICGCFGGIVGKKILLKDEIIEAGEKQGIPENDIQVPIAPIIPNDPPPEYNQVLQEIDPNINRVNEKFVLYEPIQTTFKTGGIQCVIVDRIHSTSYMQGKLLGKGGFAKCYELSESKTKIIYAGKIISKSKLVKPRQKEKILREIDLHSSLVHKHIVAFHNSFEDDLNFYIVLEFCSKKSLVHVLKARRNLTEPEARYYLTQLIDGCQYIHSQKIIHRDLKLGNMLLNDQMIVKIADFGLAVKVDFEGEKKMTVCGTPNYIAPEVLQKRGHSYEVDIWACGCIFYALLVGRPPFETPSLRETYLRISTNRFQVPGLVSMPARNLIYRLLHPDPASRPKLESILNDDFFSSGFLPTLLPPHSSETEPFFPQASKYNRSKLSTRSPNAYPAQDKLSIQKLQRHNIPFVEEPNNVIASYSPHSFNAPLILRKPTSNRISSGSIPGPSRASGQSNGLPIRRSSSQLPPPSVVRSEPMFSKISVEKHMAFYEDQRRRRRQSMDFDYNDYKSSSSDRLSITIFSAIRLYRALSNCIEVMPPDSCPTPSSNSFKALWVSKWVDYSNKYGFGFQLSDGSVGILFNDTTRMVLAKDTKTLTYNDLSNNTSIFTIDSAPSDQRKKVTLLMYFSQYMDEHLIHGGAITAAALATTSQEVNDELMEKNVNGHVFMKKWFRTDKAIVMHLSNGTLQVNFFDDHTKLILSVSGQDYLVTFIDSERSTISYRLLNLTHFGCSISIGERLKYARRMLEQIINVGGESV